MFAMIGGIFRWFGLLLLSVLLASCGGGGGGDDGGFTPERIDVTISADKTSLPVNLAAESPNPNRPYTATITARVTKSGNQFPTTITITDSSADAGLGSLFNLDNTTDGFQRIVLEDTDGIGQVFFHAGTKPGTVTITASAQDPSTNETISASVKITIVAEARPATTLSFTGPYVNAVLAGQSRFGDPPLQNGAYSRGISVVVNDANGNPTNPNTKINFFLVDAPITGYPANPGAFFIAGNDGDPVEGGYQFSAATGDFQRKGVQVFNRLVLDGRTALSPTPNNQYETGIWQVQDVLSATKLTIQQGGRPFNTSVNGINNGPTVPYLIGYAENGAVLSPAYTGINGVADTILTYPANRIGQTAVLVACAEDDSGKITACGILNTCAANGTGCKSVYLDVTNGSDRTLTVSTTTVGPNRTTDVRMCLRDVNFTPLPATEIRYNIGSAGPATVTVNGVPNTTNNKGAFFTGSDGCAVATIASSGQIPGSSPIELQFTSDFVAVPATITIAAPGAGHLEGLFQCEFKPDEGTGLCKGTLRLTDDEGAPMSGILIGVGDVEAAGPFKLTFNPAADNPNFGKTTDQGQVQVTLELQAPGDYTFPFQTASGGTAKYILSVTVPAPGQLNVTLLGNTSATVGQAYGAKLQVEGGVPPYAWAIIAGVLPPGLTLDAKTGAISGVPTTAGSFSFVAQVTDKLKNTGFAAFTIVVSTAGGGTPLTVTLTGPTTGTVGTTYNALFSASGGKAPYTFAKLAGTLPPGLNLLPTGELTGKPTTSGTYPFSVQATDGAGATGTGTFTITITGGGGGGVSPAKLTLLTSSPDLPSSGQQPVTLTAIARDTNGILLKDVVVTFQVKSGDGTLKILNATTDESGTAKAELSTGGNQRNRTIVVGASAGGVLATDVTVNVTGTTLNVSGATSGTIPISTPASPNPVKLIFTLLDSAGNAIPGAALTITGAPGGAISRQTNSSGLAEVELEFTAAGTYSINALWDNEAANASTTTLPLILTVSNDSFTVTVTDAVTGTADVVGIDDPSDDPLVTNYGNVTVTWKRNGVLVTPATITLTTNKGTLIITNPGGNPLLAAIYSSVPGSATITATGESPDPAIPKVTTQKVIQFIATTPAALTLQANPSSIAVNVPPSTSSQSTVTATVRDAVGNPVANVDVAFQIVQDVSGGSLSSASAKTNFTGQAQVAYVAGASPTPENGVIIRATVVGTALTRDIALTVSKREVFITLGTGNTIIELNPTTYALPYSVLVNDIVGGAVQGAVVTLDTVPTLYSKGYYVWNGNVWVPVITGICQNEDSNGNGILDVGEDNNNNGRLDPGNVVTTSVPSVTTDSTGFGAFDVLYAQQYANWISTELTARTKVGGSEDVEVAKFTLAGAAADFSTENVSPPGQPSPFGVVPDCTVDDSGQVYVLTSNPTTVSVTATGAQVIAGINVPLTVTVKPAYPGIEVSSTVTILNSAYSISAGASKFTDAGGNTSWTITIGRGDPAIPLTVGDKQIANITFTIGAGSVVVPVRVTQQ